MKITLPGALRFPATLAYITLCALASGCATNPVTGKHELSLVSESQEIAMGKQAAEETRQGIGVVKDDALQAYVQSVGSKLAARGERPNLPWSFQVVDDPTPNAFALPGGFIFVTRGLIGYMDSEAELAAVLGHEIGHVTAKHSVEQISRAQIAQIGLGLGMILAPDLQQFGGLLSSGMQLLFLKFGRDAERQADELGFGYALEEKYDVREMDDVFRSLRRLSKQQKDASPLPAWASTHPDEGERIAEVRKRVAALPPGALKGSRTGKEEFLTRIEGLSFGENPRQGYFEQNRFMHPDLAFQFAFPAGWKTQNLPQAVVGISPQQDAAIELTMVRDEPARAAQQFLSQQGLQAGASGRRTVNGLPAVVAKFGAQTQQGVVQGMVGFISYRNATYQLTGYSPAQRYETRERSFLNAIDSFGPLTDRTALSVQPNHIEIVKLTRAMTLEEFSRAYPSNVDIRTLAVINQVPNAAAVLPAGKWAKQVVKK